jgi:hypothetical protein
MYDNARLRMFHHVYVRHITTYQIVQVPGYTYEDYLKDRANKSRPALDEVEWLKTATSRASRARERRSGASSSVVPSDMVIGILFRTPVLTLGSYAYRVINLIFVISRIAR